MSSGSGARLSFGKVRPPFDRRVDAIAISKAPMVLLFPARRSSTPGKIKSAPGRLSKLITCYFSLFDSRVFMKLSTLLLRSSGLSEGNTSFTSRSYPLESLEKA